MIANDKRGFQTRSLEWHSRLAFILRQKGMTAKNKHLIAELEIIPLRDSSWVSASAKDVYFPADNLGVPIPRGIRCHLVADRAARDTHLKTLFQLLGVSRIDSKHAVLSCLAIEI